MKAFFRLAGILFLLNFLGSIAFPCSCLKASIEEKLQRTQYVFVGKVVEIKEGTYPEWTPEYPKRYRVELEVVEKFKGIKSDKIILRQYQIRKRSSCPNWNLQMDQVYLIFGNRSGGFIRHQVACLPTMRFNPESEVYKELLVLKGQAPRKKLQKSKLRQKN